MAQIRISAGQMVNAALVILSVVVLGFVLVRYFLLMEVSVLDEGMRPTLQKGDRVLVNRMVDEYEVGDLIVFARGDAYFVRRVVAVEGDSVAIQGGVVALNTFLAETQERGVETYTGYDRVDPEARGVQAEGPPQERAAVERSCARALESIGFESHLICLGAGPDDRAMDVEARPIFEGQFFALCDNRFDCPADSRDLGPVGKGAIRGRVTHLMSREAPLVAPSWSQQLLGLWEAL